LSPYSSGRSPGRARRLFRAASAALAFLALAGALNLLVAGPTLAQEDDAAEQAKIQRGADLFGARCAICHGADGRGIAPADQPNSWGPNIQGLGAAAFDFVIRTGRMPLEDPSDPVVHQEQKLTDPEREAIVAYARTLPGGGPDVPDVGDWEQAELARGLELFTSNCAACHGPTAAGIAVGQQDVSSNLDQATPLEIAEAIRTGPGVMPLFGEDVIDDEELESIVHWVVDLRERESPGGLSIGRSGPVTEGLVAWVVGIGLLAVVMYLLGEKAGNDEHA
jgi:ubiquinol-cytochrome c reductase cytochrome c subunit